MGAYREAFPAGSKVKVRDRKYLDSFMREWKLHNPLKDAQLNFAGQVAVVEKVGFYHGGDVLYELRDVPGIWHESCLSEARI
jgi:hypothetical protein